MSPLQWALLLFGAAAVIAVYFYSRRDRRAMEDDGTREPLLPKSDQGQLDIFASSGSQFDEFGVGKPRRVTPTVGPAPAEKGEAPAEKIVSVLVAEREGTHIRGERIHEALRAQGLEYGARSIYHRLRDGAPVFSVASMLKPGVLDPAAAASFSTPGLTLFMVLPGPQQPQDAIRDMLGTAQQLARALNAEVCDARRRPLAPAALRELEQEVEAWARARARG